MPRDVNGKLIDKYGNWIGSGSVNLIGEWESVSRANERPPLFSNPIPHSFSNNKLEETKMEIEVKKPLIIEEGKHYGVITRVEYRSTPFKYCDIYIKEDSTKLELKYGVPSYITERTKLGVLLSEFTKLDVGSKIDPEKILLGKRVSFVTVDEKGTDGTFSRISDKSVRYCQNDS